MDKHCYTKAAYLRECSKACTHSEGRPQYIVYFYELNKKGGFSEKLWGYTVKDAQSGYIVDGLYKNATDKSALRLLNDFECTTTYYISDEGNLWIEKIETKKELVG